MESTSNNFRIDRPCPLVLKKGNKVGDNYFCNSCSQTVIDFRGKTFEEIKCSLGKNTCGIFTADQLPGQKSMSFPRQLLFYGLSLLSLLGFSVKPVSAQSKETKKETVSLNAKTNSKDDSLSNKNVVSKSKTESRREHPFRRKKYRKLNRRWMGCPDF